MSTSEGWLIAAALPSLCLAPVLWYVATGAPARRLVALNLAQLLVAIALLLSAQGFRRPDFLDLALVLAVLAPAGTLVYARFLGGLRPARVVRWTALVGVPASVVPLCVTAGPGRQAVKVLVIGGLLLAGALVTGGGSQTSAESGEPEPEPQPGPGAEPGESGESGESGGPYECDGTYGPGTTRRSDAQDESGAGHGIGARRGGGGGSG
ncbi:monovalent cation/H+ antiporter complex subunit F [Streptomyces marispadix]|uniref:Monovalent cation/H+ antiporter complex subunit F n=1 Tax=Streptomyces marispadix TaxID=2922868 RepID=A0ABS9SWP5_9ACTN|nr:monovalent cation/H+ antiporter complex subunit F [Streptomyces marispadix]MCH6160675.1 monovalent cation/H+ antiporter complex subunit F [Streptomyces marispadix]